MFQELKAALAALVALALLIIGFLIGKWAYEPKTATITTTAPAHSQKQLQNGAILAARGNATQPPAQSIPPADTPTATAHVHVAAQKPVPASAAAHVPAAQLEVCQQLLQCPAVNIDETLVKDKAGDPDLIVSGPGVDQAQVNLFPGPLVVPAPMPWGAGGTWDSNHQFGVFVDRDLGRLRIGVEVNEVKVPGQRAMLEEIVKFGIRF